MKLSKAELKFNDSIVYTSLANLEDPFSSETHKGNNDRGLSISCAFGEIRKTFFTDLNDILEKSLNSVNYVDR